MCIFLFFRSYSIKGILDFLDKADSDQTSQIFIESLNVHKLRDENSGDENDCHVDRKRETNCRNCIFSRK